MEIFKMLSEFDKYKSLEEKKQSNIEGQIQIFNTISRLNDLKEKKPHLSNFFDKIVRIKEDALEFLKQHENLSYYEVCLKYEKEIERRS